MAKNPRRKSDTGASTDSASTETDTTPTEEVSNMSDTATTEETTETTAPAEAKVAVDHEANLVAAITQFESDGEVGALQEAYRAVPVAARGKAQGAALKQAMSSGTSMETLGQVLDAFSNLPAATKTTRTAKVELDPVVEGAVRLAGFMVAFDQLRTELGDESYNLADNWYQEKSPEEYRSAVENVVSNIISGSVLKGNGTRGPRHTFKQSFKELVDSGVIPAGSQLTGAGGATAEVTTDGKIRTDNGEFDAPSAAAKGAATTKDGKEATLNGWAFWQYDGKAIGSLRTA